MKLGEITLKKTLLRTLLALVFFAAVAVFCTISPIRALSSPNPVQNENSLPGTTSWLIATPRQDEVQGYFGDVSYLPGQNATLYVNSSSNPFSYTVYRMGYYQGLGGREITSGTVANNGPQPRPIVDPGPKLLTTGWNKSATIPLGSNWASGYYLVKLHNNVNGGESYANFILRSSAPAQIVINLSTNTWQAYNLWGGLSLYNDVRQAPPSSTIPDHFANEANMVSFLRPYLSEGGAGQFFLYDNPLVSWAESLGYPVSYSTDEDVRSAREAGPNTKLVIFSGHAEYYSMADRNELQRLTANGVSEAFFGGNAWAWQARFTDKVNNKGHIMTVWRFASVDPVTSTKLKTTRWVLVGLPQDMVTGEMQTWGTQTGAQTAYATSSWPWDGAGVVSGQQLGPVEGTEWDGIVVNPQMPTNLLMLSRTPFSGMSHVPADQAMTLWQKTSSAFVFEGGQTGFNWNLAYPGQVSANWIGGNYPTNSQVKPAILRLVGNLIQRATGISNPTPTIVPTAAPVAFHIVAPQANQDIQSAPKPFSVSWSDPPAGATVKIYVDNKLVGSASSGNVFVGTGLVIGIHTIRLVAGSSASQENVNVLDYTKDLFHANPYKISVEWDNDTRGGPLSLVCNPLSFSIKALSPTAQRCW